MILGQDWLESVSPMWVHWAKKKMRFTHEGQRISLRGLTVDASQCTAVSAAKFKGLLNRHALTHCIQLMFMPAGE